MRHLWLLVLLLTLPGTAGSPLRYDDADLRVGVALLPESSLTVRLGASAARGQDSASIRIGDPASIRVRLWNAGDAASVPIVGLSPRMAPMVVVVKQPDGTVVYPPWESRMGVVRARWGSPEPMQPGEEQILEAYLFEHPVTDAGTGMATLRYLFEEPGRYEIHVEYWAGDPADHHRFLKGERAERPPVLLSAQVVLNVAEPPIQGWEELKDAEILQFAGNSRWPALVDSTSPINATIDAADRPWLTEWRDHLFAPASGE